MNNGTITDFRLIAMESRAYEPAEAIKKIPAITINYDLNLKCSVFESNDQKESMVRVGFTWAINYLNPSVGYIRFDGVLDYITDDVSVITNAKDTGKLPIEINNVITGTLIQNLAPIAMMIAQANELPPAMPLPLPVLNGDGKKPKDEPTIYG